MSCLNFKTFVLKYTYSNNFKTIFLTVSFYVYEFSQDVCQNSTKTKELYCKINDEKECECDLRNDFIPLSYGKILDKKERNDCRVPSV